MFLRRGGSSRFREKYRKANKKKHEPLKFKQLYHLGHRFLIILIALFYVILSFLIASDAVALLRGRRDPMLPNFVREYPLIKPFLGDTTIRESLLVKRILHDSTTPISDTIYLESREKASYTECINVPTEQIGIYTNEFQRSVYSGIASGVSYNLTHLATSEMELIAPVVDCTSGDIIGDATRSRFYFLVRERRNADNVSIVVVSLSNQLYSVPARGENAPAAVATIQIIHDMRQTSVDHRYIVSMGYPFKAFSFRVFEYVNTTVRGLLTLTNVPASDEEIPTLLQTANRDGFYIKAESEQSNINNFRWLTETDPVLVVSRWTFVVQPVLRDSWAWVHVIQFYIGFSLLLNLVILGLATYRNVMAGKWWIGDAYVSISTSQLLNGALVLLSWFMNEYWVLHEFSFYIGYELSGVTNIRVNEIPFFTSALTIYLSASGLIGQLLKERVDPFYTTIYFVLGFLLRLPILRSITSIRDSINEFAIYSYRRGSVESIDGQDAVSPMRLWTTHPIGKRNYTFVMQCLFPIYASLLLVVINIVYRKVRRRLYPDRYRVAHGSNTPTQHSVGDDALLVQKRVLTLFEVATGAELENRFGLVSDYETCIFIKGMKFASADGIYSTGFVIANKKYLLQTSDYWSIVLMKLLRRRFRNIYVYDVNGSTVQQTARLVYPHTLTVQDLTNINVSVLS